MQGKIITCFFELCLVTIILYPVLFWRTLATFFRKLISFHPSLNDVFRTCVTLNTQAFKTKLLGKWEGRGELPYPIEPKKAANANPNPFSIHWHTSPASSLDSLSEALLPYLKRFWEIIRANFNSYVRQILRRISSANISFEKSKKFAIDVNRSVLRYSNMDGC